MAKYLDDTALAELVSKTEARYQKASNAVTTDTAQTISAQKTFSKTILSSANEPLNFTGYGSGIYNRAAFVCNTTDKFGVECPRETDSASGTIVPFRIGVRGGQLGDLQSGNLTVGTKAYISTINNGGDITIPSSSGTMALVGDVPTTTSSVTQNSTAVLTSGGAYTALADKVDKVSGKGLSTNDFVSANYYTKTQIDGIVSAVYKPAGSVAFASLPTLAAGVLGNVYNVTDSFTTTSDFVEGSGTTYPAGTNVVVVDASSTSTPDYKFDVLSGFVDLSGYATTSQIPTSVDGLSGGAISSAVTVSASGDTPIIVSSQYYDTYIQFKGAGTVHGHIGVSQTGKPIFFDSSAHELAFASNVPTTTDSVTQNSTAALTSGGAYTALSGKQDTLPTTTTAGKVLKSTSTAGTVEWGDVSSGSSTDVQVNGTSIVSNGVANLVTNTAYDASSNKLATMSDIPSDGGNSETTIKTARPIVNSLWKTKTWSGLTSFRGRYLWSDGIDIYYSGGSSSQYVLDKSTSTWSAKTWTGYTDMVGNNIWSDGINIYYSSSTTQYVLQNSNWVTKTWTGLTNFSGEHVWTDGINYYYSYNGNNYVLDISTSTWSTKTWTGLTNFRGKEVWTDGTDIYYMYYGGSDTYKLDKTNSSWSVISSLSFSSASGVYTWTDGGNIYHSYSTLQKVLNKKTLTWENITWSSTSINGTDIWTDGEYIYYSNNATQLVLARKSSKTKLK